MVLHAAVHGVLGQVGSVLLLTGFALESLVRGADIKADAQLHVGIVGSGERVLGLMWALPELVGLVRLLQEKGVAAGCWWYGWRLAALASVRAECAGVYPWMSRHWCV